MLGTTRRLSRRRVVLFLVVVAMVVVTVGEVAYLTNYQLQSGGPAILVGGCIVMVLVFPIVLLVGRVRKVGLFLSHLVLAIMVGLFLTYGQLVWFQLFLLMEIPMEKMLHLMAGYMLGKVTLMKAIQVLAPAPRQRG